MNNKNNGFTLSEIMISIGIIGILAGLMTPSIIKTTTVKSTGAKVANFVEQIEYGCRNIINTANSSYENNGVYTTADILYPIELQDIIENPTAENNTKIFSANGYDETIEGFFNAQKTADSTNGRTFRDFNGSSLSGTLETEVLGYLASAKVYKNSNTQAEFYATNIVPANVDDSDAFIMFLAVDINGDSGHPNRFGKDLFAFKLRNDGKMIPYGDSDQCYKNNITHGISCSATLVNDGFEVKYQ